MRTFIYFRGAPGVGKITVARLLQERIGWKLFWFHDLKNAVQRIVGEYRIPRLMDEVTIPVIRYLLAQRQNLIYVRPSSSLVGIEKIQQLVTTNLSYQFVVVRLEASYKTLQSRVTERSDPYRIDTQKKLDEYLANKSVADFPGEHRIDTDGLTANEVATQVEAILEDPAQSTGEVTVRD